MSHPTAPVVVITGGGSGIGRATADLYVERGAVVVVLDKVVGETAGFTGIQLDARDATAVTAAMNAVAAEHGRIDVLVNAVGVEFVGTIDETSADDWQRIIATNLTTYFNACHAAAPHLTRPGGAIVNVASQLALVGSARFSAYTASKAGIVGFTRSLALELAPQGIRVNALCPGAVDTPLLQRQFAEGDGPQGSMADLVGMHPLGRLGEPREIAAPIVFLAGPDASFITGSAMVVDGGYTTH